MNFLCKNCILDLLRTILKIWNKQKDIGHWLEPGRRTFWTAHKWTKFNQYPKYRTKFGHLGKILIKNGKNHEFKLVRKWAQSIYIYVKTAQPNFMWDLTWPQGRFMNAQNYKKLYPNLFVLSKRKGWKIKHIFKVEIEDGHKASW